MAFLRSVALAFLSLTMGAAAQQIPPVHGTTFTGVPVDLPAALQGKAGIFVVGFSQGSRDAVTVWAKRLAPDFYDSPSVLCYQMPVLASVPKFMRGFVEGRIKSSVSDRGKPHFLPISDHEAEWRQLLHYSDAHADDAYVIVVDEAGRVRWQTQGPPTEATYAAIKQQVETLRPH